MYCSDVGEIGPFEAARCAAVVDPDERYGSEGRNRELIEVDQCRVDRETTMIVKAGLCWVEAPGCGESARCSIEDRDGEFFWPSALEDGQIWPVRVDNHVVAETHVEDGTSKRFRVGAAVGDHSSCTRVRRQTRQGRLPKLRCDTTLEERGLRAGHNSCRVSTRVRLERKAWNGDRLRRRCARVQRENVHQVGAIAAAGSAEIVDSEERASVVERNA